MEKADEKNRMTLWIRAWRWIDKNSAILVLILALTTYFSAFTGVSITAPPTNEQPSAAMQNFNWFTDKCYESAQAIFLNMSPHDREFNVCIGIARLAAVLLVGLVATQAIGKLFKESFDKIWLELVAERKLLGLGTARRSVLVGGLGMIGRQLVADLTRDGKNVIALEIQVPEYWKYTAADTAALVVDCDVTNIKSLREHIFRNPETIYLVTGNDLANVNALVNIKKLRSEYRQNHGQSLGACTCYIHIDDPALHRTLHRCLMELNFTSDPTLDIKPFNLAHETACQLIIDELAAIRPRKREQVALYVIFGFGKMGMAMLKELVEFAHFENQKRARILVMVPPGSESDAAEAAYRDCAAQWSSMTPRFVHRDLTEVNFDPRCDDWFDQSVRLRPGSTEPLLVGEVEYAANVHFCCMRSAKSISTEEALALAVLAGAAENSPQVNSNVKPAVLFCFDEDETNFRLANELNDLFQDLEGINVDFPNHEVPADERAVLARHYQFTVPIFAFLPISGPLREILRELASNGVIKPFGDVKEGMERAQDPLIEKIAIGIAWAYDAEASSEAAETKKDANQGTNDNAASPREIAAIDSDNGDGAGVIPLEKYLPIWQKKRFWEQVSNRNAAEHSRVAIQILGFEIASAADQIASFKIDFDVFEAEDKRKLATIEHNRWMAERLLMGWRHGSKMAQPPQRPSFRANENLDPHELAKDYKQVQTVFESLRKCDLSFRRA